MYVATFMKTPSCYIKALNVCPLTVEKCPSSACSNCVFVFLYVRLLLQPPSFHFIIQSDMSPLLFGKGCYFARPIGSESHIHQRHFSLYTKATAVLAWSCCLFKVISVTQCTELRQSQTFFLAICLALIEEDDFGRFSK